MTGLPSQIQYPNQSGEKRVRVNTLPFKATTRTFSQKSVDAAVVAVVAPDPKRIELWLISQGNKTIFMGDGSGAVTVASGFALPQERTVKFDRSSGSGLAWDAIATGPGGDLRVIEFFEP